MNKISIKRTIALLLCMCFPPLAMSQTPSELALLSLNELMDINIHEYNAETQPNNERWSINYGYQQLRLDGYRTGTNDLSDQAVLFTPEETRTTTNYPILPTTIIQEVHSINLNYQWNSEIQVGITAPYILQETDHLSSVANFDEFTLDSAGIGDISLNLSYQLPSQNTKNWEISVAMTLPTGSIKEQGDTPRDGSGSLEQLPYTMQLGSGTYDFPVSIQFSDHSDNIHYGAQANILIRTGKNSQGYRLGNNYGIKSWARWMTSSWFHPGISLGYRHSKEIQGIDNSLTAADEFPFPANITDPNNYGSDTVDLGFSMKICSATTRCKHYLDLNVNKAVYQRLNGIQIKEQLTLGFSTGMRF